MSQNTTVVNRIDDLLNSDGYLRLHEQEIRRRFREFSNKLEAINKSEGLTPFPLLAIVIRLSFRLTYFLWSLDQILITNLLNVVLQVWNNLSGPTRSSVFTSMTTTASHVWSGVRERSPSSLGETSMTGTECRIRLKNWISVNGN